MALGAAIDGLTYLRIKTCKSNNGSRKGTRNYTDMRNVIKYSKGGRWNYPYCNGNVCSMIITCPTTS